MEKEEFEFERIVGVFYKSESFGFVKPDNRKVGIDIYIPKRFFKKAKNNDKVVVEIIKKPIKNKKPEGKIIEILGNVNVAGIDMLSVIKEYNLPYEFPKKVLEEAKNISNIVNKKDLPYRTDLRKEQFFTIDGDDAKDLDDAVMVKKIDDKYILTVSIADVSHYVKEGSFLDKEAIYRGTSVYMFDRVIPMLPEKLSNGVCSLNANEDRLALSVSMEIDKNGKVISSEIFKSIINVKERMTYTNVDKILKNEDEKILKKYSKYIQDFKNMEELSNILKTKRNKDGNLDLDLPESKIILDENGIAIDIQKKDAGISTGIIEQFMVITNEQVAEKFFYLEAPFLYRVHENPDIDKVKELNKFLYNLGYKIKISKDTIYPKAFSEILEKIKGHTEEMVISNLILRTLKIARYENENQGHFGLASKFYCHFTSPIRRYPDLFIHRVISKYLKNNYNIDEKTKERYFKQSEEYAKNSSETEKVAQKAERDAEDIKKAEYMQDKIGEKFTAIISSVTSFGIFVELENTVEGLVRFENMGDDYYVFDEERKILIGERNKKVYKIGDIIDVELVEADKISRRISFKIITPK